MKKDSYLLVSVIKNGSTIVAYLLVHVQLPENLSSIQKVGVVNDPRMGLARSLGIRAQEPYFFTFHARRGKLRIRATQ